VIKRRRRPREREAPGEDSFLDIVANLVGILVILVTVIGVRAQDAWVESSTQPTDVEASAVQAADVTRARRQVENLTSNVHEIDRQAGNLQQLAAQRGVERHRLQVLLTAARRAIDERRQRLDQDRRQQLELQSVTRQLSAQLAGVREQQQTLDQMRQEPIVLEHLPTPLAETVFGAEEHYRLLGGRLAYVPLNALTDMLRAEAPRKVERLRSAPQMTDTIGPIQGFHLRYSLRRRNYARFTKSGAVVRQVAELERFVLVPLSDNLGEDLNTALTPNSQFRQQLAAYRPGETVITVWTYPDSYQQFGRLKRWLFERGFATAARPLPDGQPISGSPNGSRSAAQ
jgi:hypothetical protein